MKKYTGHTKGPWKAHLNVPTAVIEGHLIKADNEIQSPVASLWVGGGTKGKPTQVANAKLIADAPMLLSQLNEAVELMREVIQLGHSNSDKICKCPDCKNAIKIKKFLNTVEGGK